MESPFPGSWPSVLLVELILMLMDLWTGKNMLNKMLQLPILQLF
jgi:hypothetical protein